MAQYNFLNVADTYGQGRQDRQREDYNALRMQSAEKNMDLQERRVGLAEQKYSQEQKVENTKRLLNGVRLAKQNPGLVPQIVGDLSSAGILDPQRAPQIIQQAQQNPEQFMSSLDQLETQLQYAVGPEPGNQAKPPASIAEYELARQQGYEGSFMDYQRESSGMTGSRYSIQEIPRSDGTTVSMVFDKATGMRTPLAQFQGGAALGGGVAGGQEQPSPQVGVQRSPEDEKEAIARREAEVESELTAPERIIGINRQIDSVDQTLATIDEALGVADWKTAGIVGALTQDLAGTPAKDFKEMLKPVIASLAFDRLQQMRDMSKTGGALGQVSERELDLLAGAVKSLEQAQSVPSMVRALKAVREHYGNVRRYMGGMEAMAAGAPFVASPDEARKLPPGTQFVDPKGNIRVVPGG